MPNIRKSKLIVHEGATGSTLPVDPNQSNYAPGAGAFRNREDFAPLAMPVVDWKPTTPVLIASAAVPEGQPQGVWSPLPMPKVDWAATERQTAQRNAAPTVQRRTTAQPLGSGPSDEYVPLPMPQAP
jgi:hypothetical protein